MAQALISVCGATRQTELYPSKLSKEYTLSAYDETGAEKELSFETSRILTDDACF